MSAPERWFTHTGAQWNRGPLRPLTANVFVPGELKIVGAVNWSAVRSYLQEAFERLRRVGIDVVVFGSAPARVLPEGYSLDAAYDDIERFLVIALELADGDVRIGIEPIWKPEAVVFPTFRSAADFIDERGLSAVGITMDSFHLANASESAADLEGQVDKIFHVHISGIKRGEVEDEDVDYLTAIGETLRKGGYAGRCSFEIHWSEPAFQVAESLKRIGAFC
jgi:sugar phosphate isomerase/epimerase